MVAVELAASKVTALNRLLDRLADQLRRDVRGRAIEDRAERGGVTGTAPFHATSVRARTSRLSR